MYKFEQLEVQLNLEYWTLITNKAGTRNFVLSHTHNAVIFVLGEGRDFFLSISWHFLPNTVKLFTECFQGSVVEQFFSVNLLPFEL